MVGKNQVVVNEIDGSWLVIIRVMFGGFSPARVAGSTVATANQARAIIMVDQNLQPPSRLTRLFLVDHRFLVIIDHAFFQVRLIIWVFPSLVDHHVYSKVVGMLGSPVLMFIDLSNTNDFNQHLHLRLRSMAQLLNHGLKSLD